MKDRINRQRSIEERIKHFNEFHTPLSAKKNRSFRAHAVWRAEFRSVSLERCLQEWPVAVHCTTWCRSGMILIYNGNWEEAYLRLKKTNNFPEFTSRVCPALCENACTCGLNQEASCIKK